MYRELEYYKGYRIQIIADEDPPNPRQEFDNFGHLIGWHRRYWIGDYDRKGNVKNWYERDSETFNEWAWPEPEDETQKYPEQNPEIAVILPLYLYDHGGITISTGPFSCPWDSGQVGWTYCTVEEVIAEYDQDTPETRQKAEALLKAEVEVYDQYLTGDVWGYAIDTFIGETEEDGEPVDPEDYLETDNLWEDAYGHNSCWGFYGKKYCLEEAKTEVDAHIAYMEKKEAERVEKLETSHQYLFVEREAVGL